MEWILLALGASIIFGGFVAFVNHKRYGNANAPAFLNYGHYQKLEKRIIHLEQKIEALEAENAKTRTALKKIASNTRQRPE